MSNLLKSIQIYSRLVVMLTILDVAYLIAKLSVYFVFALANNQPNYVVRSLWTACLSEVIIKERLINR